MDVILLPDSIRGRILKRPKEGSMAALNFKHLRYFWMVAKTAASPAPPSSCT